MTRVPCSYPVKEEDRELPEGWDEWATSETCDHEFCIEVAGYQRQWASERQHRESVAIARQDLDMPYSTEREVDTAILLRLK